MQGIGWDFTQVCPKLYYDQQGKPAGDCHLRHALPGVQFLDAARDHTEIHAKLTAIITPALELLQRADQLCPSDFQAPQLSVVLGPILQFLKAEGAQLVATHVEDARASDSRLRSRYKGHAKLHHTQERAVAETAQVVRTAEKLAGQAQHSTDATESIACAGRCMGGGRCLSRHAGGRTSCEAVLRSMRVIMTRASPTPMHIKVTCDALPCTAACSFL